MNWRVRCVPRAWPMREPFAIARGVQTEQPTLFVEIEDRGLIGRGEACGVPYKGETPASMQAQIEALPVCSFTRLDLLKLLPAGGARMALDAALWDIEAKRGQDPFVANGVKAGSIVTARTIGIRSLAAYEEAARSLQNYAVLKVKVDGLHPVEAIEAIRRGAPNPRLIVDPNQSWTIGALKNWARALADLGVVLVEQPIPIGAEAELDGYRSPVALCADELIDEERDLVRAQGRFSAINIKLDKTGGLTAAMQLADKAAAMGFDLMVGCMAGSSLCMAPAMVLAQRCAHVDLDGPLLHACDCEPGFEYIDGEVASPHLPALWG